MRVSQKYFACLCTLGTVQTTRSALYPQNNLTKTDYTMNIIECVCVCCARCTVMVFLFQQLQFFFSLAAASPEFSILCYTLKLCRGRASILFTLHHSFCPIHHTTRPPHYPFVQVCRPLWAQFKWIYMGHSYTSFYSVRFFCLVCMCACEHAFFYFHCFIVVFVFRTFTIIKLPPSPSPPPAIL